MNGDFEKKIVPYSEYEYAYSDNKSKRYPNNYVVFDTETTGLEPSMDRIIEISAIKYINGKATAVFSQMVNPQEEISPFITQLTGIENSDLYNKPTIKQVLPLFFEFIEDFVLVAHNTPYDIKMIASECYRSNIKMCSNKLIDTVPLAKKMIDKNEVDNHKLSTLKLFYGINIPSHRATEDCIICNIVYQTYLQYEKIHSKNKKVSKIEDKIRIINFENGEIDDIPEAYITQDDIKIIEELSNINQKYNSKFLEKKSSISPSILITGFIGGILGLILLGILCSIPSLESPITVLFPIIFLSLLIASIITLSIGLENIKKDNENNFMFKLSLIFFVLGLLFCILTPFINRIID